MILAEKLSDKETIFDPETLQIYYSTSNGLTPILSENEYYPFSHFQEKNMFSVSELKNLDNYEFLRKNNELSTVNLQKTERKNNGQSTENPQESNGKFSRNLRNLDKTLTEKRADEIINNNNLTLYSHFYKGKIKELTEQIENYTIVILFNTNKKATIDKTKIEFREAAKYAAKNKDIELDQILSKLKARREGQLKISKMNETVNRRADRHRFKIIAVVGLILFVAVFAIGKQILHSLSSTTPLENNISNIETKKIFSEDEINDLINIFCNTKDTLLTDWRVNFIVNNFPSEPLTKSEAFQQINFFSLNP